MKRSIVSLLLVSAACSLTGCATKTPAVPMPAWNSAERSRYIEDRANQLVARGAPPGKAIGAAELDWDSRAAPELPARAQQRAAQQQFVDDLEKMQRSPR